MTHAVPAADGEHDLGLGYLMASEDVRGRLTRSLAASWSLTSELTTVDRRG